MKVVPDAVFTPTIRIGIPIGSPAPMASLAPPTAKIRVYSPVTLAFPLSVSVPVPEPDVTVVPEAKGVPAGALKGSVTTSPATMPVGKFPPPLLASTVMVGWPLVTSTFTSRLGPRFVNWPQSVIWLPPDTHQSR